MENAPSPTDASDAPWRRDLLILALIFGALYFFVLGRPPLANPDEGRYAEIPREMVASGDWVTPRLDGVPYFEKPPLVYWVVAASLEAFGPGEWAVRAPIALFALGGVLLAYAAGRRLHGRDAGLGATAVLGSSLLYFALGRIVLLDLAVSVLMSAALFCFILGVREAPGARRRQLFYALYAAAALATLTKGLIGFLVTGAVMFFWLLLFNQWRRLRPFYLPTGALLFLAIALPWHLLVARRNEGWAHFYFIHEHWERFTTTEHGRVLPWWIYFPIVLVGLFPWTGFLWASLRDALAGGWARRKEKADAWFLVTWAGFIFLFFSKSQSKLIPYILPVFPPLAVIIGAWLARRWREGGAARLRGGLGVFAFFCGVLAIGLVVAVLKPGTFREPGQAEALRPFAYAMAALLVTGGILAPWLARLRGVRDGLTAVFMSTLGFLLVLALAFPNIRSTRTLALIARDRVGPQDVVYHYHAFFHDFTYYTGRVVGLVSYKDELELQFLSEAERNARFIDDAEFLRQWAGPRRVWLVARKDAVAPLLDDSSFHYHLLGETPTHYLWSNQP
ncbi:MAG TPA: phospholipid carrier-dependent glycosyltransferase [Opitutaceae bacterium]|nr:phospholipid carrier-dependent glycosyltransferase [Lacunisphaera sp.]HWA09203.1 phospholipid carrier-dependent glycosyltransferase [Opitutaceae bacterium]